MFLTAVIPLRVQRLLSTRKALGSILGQKETEEGRGRGREEGEGGGRGEGEKEGRRGNSRVKTFTSRVQTQGATLEGTA